MEERKYQRSTGLDDCEVGVLRNDVIEEALWENIDRPVFDCVNHGDRVIVVACPFCARTDCERQCVRPPPQQDNGPFSNLPAEVRVKIFSYLTPQELCRYAAPVCREWRILCTESSLWRSINISDRWVPTAVLAHMLQRTDCSVKRLSISGQPQRSALDVAVWSRFCTSLTHLDLGFAPDFDTEQLRIVVANCPLLRHLNVRDWTLDKERISLIHQLSHLEEVKLTECWFRDNDKAVTLLCGMKRLTSVDLWLAEQIDDDTVQQVVQSHGGTLRHVVLGSDGVQLSDDSVVALAQCRHLTSLSLFSCQHFTDDCLPHIKSMSNLKCLRISWGRKLSSAGLTTLFQGRSLSQLTRLDLGNCPQLEDCGLISAVECCGRHLTELSLRCCRNLTDTSIAVVIHTCRWMKYMDFHGCTNVKGKCFLDIPENMPWLTDLRCSDIEDSIKSELKRLCRHLKVTTN